jgi:5-deoxy-glucuronate isomerase
MNYKSEEGLAMASSLLIKSKGFHEGYVTIATPTETALRWISVGRLGLVNSSYEGNTNKQELVITILSGSVKLEIANEPPQVIAGRSDMFTGGPTYICLPPDTTFSLKATSPTSDLVLFYAPTDDGAGTHIIRPENSSARTVGAHNWTRTVWPGTGTNDSTKRLLVGETINIPGNWSSYPPHKHDTDNPPREAVYEEVYFFSVKPVGGFGIQRIYERTNEKDTLDEVFAVEDGDTVIIPRGYHPVVAAPGYQLGYIWALCGTGHAYGAWNDDPAHAWIRAIEPILQSR